MSMKIIKKLNHNVLLVEEKGQEKIAMGRGIGFSAVVNEILDPSTVEKIFIPDSKENTKRFTELAAQIPFEFIDFTEELVTYISGLVDESLNSNILIALTDHIYFAIQRQKEGGHLNAILLPEMKLYYPKEYKIAGDVVQKINQKFDVNLEESEIGFITMHIINAELGEKNSLNSLKILEITSDLIQFIESKLSKTLDKDSLDFHRLIIHIKFLVQRLIYQENLKDNYVSFFNDDFKKSSPYQLALDVKERIESKYELPVPDNEVNYLAVHLTRIE